MSKEIFRQRPKAPASAMENVHTESQPEMTQEVARECVERMKTTGRKFEEALSRYHELLEQQATTEANIAPLKKRIEMQREAERVKARAAKLSWAVARYMTSSSIVSAGAAAGTYALTGDASMSALAGAGGALAGAAIETGLAAVEEKADLSEEFFANHPKTAEYMRQKKEQAEGKSNIPEIVQLNTQLTELQKHIADIEVEIDQLGANGFALLRQNEREGRRPDDNEQQARARESVQQLAAHMKTASTQLDALLHAYHQRVQAAEGAEEYLSQARDAVANREFIIEANVTVRKIWQVAKTTHLVLATGGITGTAAWMYSGVSGWGHDPTAAGIAGGAIGAAMAWFQFSRVEKTVWQNNIPRGQFELGDRLGVDSEFQRFSDNDLREGNAILEQAQALRDELFADQERLSKDLDRFMKAYPMK